jgi:ABC-type multidrug transport system ATPase subunit
MTNAALTEQAHGTRRSVLDVTGLTVRRDGRSVVSDVSFRAREGEVLAVLGPNGAGKTTLLEALVGLLPTENAVVRFAGDRVESFRERAGVFAYMPDEARLAEETTVASALGVERLEHAADLVTRRAGTLSRGEEKRAWIAWTLSLGRPVSVLDEPFGAFDPVELDGILDLVRAHARKGSAVITTIHQMAIADRIADRVVIMHEGRVVAEGTPAELGPLEEAFRAHVADA